MELSANVQDCPPEQDRWSKWLLHTRYGNDPEEKIRIQAELARIANRLLAPVKWSTCSTLLDIGSGDGLVAFRAIELAGDSLRVVVNDSSRAILDVTEREAKRRNVHVQCQFLHSSAEQLNELGNESVDVITCRASLAYVPDKMRALEEFFRVLRPGGRIMIAEPILQDEALFVRAIERRLNEKTPGSHGRLLKLIHIWKSAQFPDSSDNALINFSERDLLNYFLKVGFRPVRLQLRIDVKHAPPMRWDAFLDGSPHPLAPTLREIIRDQFGESEKAEFENALQPVVEAGHSLTTTRVCYLSAKKPKFPVVGETWI